MPTLFLIINFSSQIVAHQPQQDRDLDESMAAPLHHNFLAPLPVSVAQRMYPPGTFWHEPRAGCSKDFTQPNQPLPQPDASEMEDDDYMPVENPNDAIEAEDFLPSSVAQSLAEEELDREHIQGSCLPESSGTRKRRRRASNLSRHTSAHRRAQQEKEARNEAAAQRGSQFMPDPESREEEQEEESAPHGSRRETLAERREEQQDRIQARLKKKRTHNKALADLDSVCLLYTSPSPRD